MGPSVSFQPLAFGTGTNVGLVVELEKVVVKKSHYKGSLGRLLSSMWELQGTSVGALSGLTAVTAIH